ncbi:MAG: FkbM family methyltransferase [Candidatus Parcubacteria bacterium]|nr:FkbM family methyltransferase [Burkholderiales bacterium]
MAGLLRNLRSRLRNVPLAAWAYHRAREFLLPLGAPMATTPWGFRMAGHVQMQSGEFEPEEVALMRALLRQHDVLVDVGANIGLYTCLARSLGRRAIAVEPLPANLRFLRANLAANDWSDTEVAEAGLACEAGSAELFGTATGASLVAGWASLPRRTLMRHTIRLTSLDALLGERFAGERLLIKADIEGAEHGMLQGARRTLGRDPAPTWLVEICLTENFPDGANPNYAATFEEFFSRGYSARTANAAARPVSPEEVLQWVAQGRVASGSYNYLFTR